MTQTARKHRAKLQVAALDAAQKRLKAVRRIAWDLEPISEREYIERALAFSTWNGETEDELQQHELALLIGCRALDRDYQQLARLPYAKLSATFIRKGWSNPKFAHRTLRDCLAHITAAHKPERRRMLELSGVRLTIGSEQQVDSVALWSGSGSARDGQLWMLFPLDLPTAVVKAVQLLADTTRPFGQQLAQCQLEGCGGYFIRQPTTKGGKPAMYHDQCRRKLRAKSRHIRRRQQEIDQ